jgi:hypothetical protein
MAANAAVAPIATARLRTVKLLLIPLAILAFVIFLLVLGAIGLGVAFAVLYVLGKFWSLISRGRPRRRRASTKPAA